MLYYLSCLMSYNLCSPADVSTCTHKAFQTAGGPSSSSHAASATMHGGLGMGNFFILYILGRSLSITVLSC